MEHQPGDDWFDKAMVFLSNWAQPIAREWFKLLQWSLTISIFAYLSNITASYVYDYVLTLSYVIFGAYLFFGYMAAWHDHFHDQLTVKL